MAVEFEQRTFTVEDYHRMAACGILDEDERIELLDGLIVAMPPIGTPHWTTHGRITAYLIRALAEYAQVQGQISVPLGTRDEPQPDLAILADRRYDRPGATFGAGDVYATIEIAESSLARDTRHKRRLYARHAIPDYLVVDTRANVLLHFTRPLDGDYAEPAVLLYGATFRLAAVPSVELDATPFLRPLD